MLARQRGVTERPPSEPLGDELLGDQPLGDVRSGEPLGDKPLGDVTYALGEPAPKEPPEEKSIGGVLITSFP
jgi:hypothetical protein